ncbi:hypothetical protein BV22DRAFT_1134003 [Leucogyrophana mollusca]|uniref:Uncharacterized protein n=1 Tax=Leucogyrophana mollusca TaxID=85980 RepID=A0ACB8B0L1_9AGAM|nr:hypothetical protein BV22DRAFT_1134003 [Leucogyrophana mollusca]
MRKPEVEILHIEYWQKLVNLTKSKSEFNSMAAQWDVSTPQNTVFGQCDINNTTKTEMARRHIQEVYETNLKVVQLLEKKLDTV